MADKNQLTRWLLAKRPLFNPKFTEFDWPSRYFAGIYDFSTRVITADCCVEGRGIDEDRELALEKSVSEAIERLICHRLNISSVGVAIAGRNGAEDHAIHEALERYFLVEQMRLNYPFFPIPESGHPLSSISNHLKQAFSHQNPEAHAQFYLMAAPIQYVGSVCQITHSTQPDFLGFSLSQSPSHSLNRAFREACANFARMKDSPTHFNEECLADQNLWQLQSEFLNEIQPLLNGDGSLNTFPIAEPEIGSEPIGLTAFADLKDCPVEPFRVRIGKVESL